MHAGGWWLADSGVLLLTSQWYCQAAVLAVSLSSGQVTPITPVDVQDASYSLAAIAGATLLAQTKSTSPTTGIFPWENDVSSVYAQNTNYCLAASADAAHLLLFLKSPVNPFSPFHASHPILLVCRRKSFCDPCLPINSLSASHGRSAPRHHR